MAVSKVAQYHDEGRNNVGKGEDKVVYVDVCMGVGGGGEGTRVRVVVEGSYLYQGNHTETVLLFCRTPAATLYHPLWPQNQNSRARQRIKIHDHLRRTGLGVEENGVWVWRIRGGVG